jgi:DNA polymerase/3'-5' exonuclease PolX
MNLYTVIYLLNKIYLNKVNNDNSQSNIFIKLAYNKVIKLMIERFSETEKITESKLNELNITNNMKDKLINIIKLKIKKNNDLKLNELNITNNMKDKLLNKLTEIDGIGKSKALELIKLGINSIADLKKKKWYDLLNKTTKAYLNYKPLKQIPYNFIKSLEKYITSYNKNQIKIVGGYARKKKNSKDIDLVFINSSKNKIDKSSEIDKYIEYLKQYFTIIIYLRGDDKLSLLIKLKTNYGNVLYKNINTKYIKVDIFITNENEKYFMILYGTGSKEFNIKMRGIARRKGYILNQKHLMRIKDNNKIWVSSEKEIFDILDMEYTKPETR